MISVKDLEKSVIKDLESKYSEQEIKNVFSKYNLEDMLESPFSPTKLLLQRLRFEGEKDLDKENPVKFCYDRLIYNGVNVWVADNFSGKSTVLKLIKWCLTGKSDIKPDVKKWIKMVLLQFELRNIVYTIRIDSTSSRPNGALYKAKLEQLINENQSLEEHEAEFTFNNAKDMENKLQSFFMLNLGLYPLKWTQKNSSKDSIGLVESNTSWSTYFKALFLKSDEYNSFLMSNEQSYGKQTQKVLGMFLGWNLLKMQNRLSFRVDMIRNELAKEDLIKNNGRESSNEMLESLQKEYDEIVNDRKILEEELTKLVDQSRLNTIITELGKVNITLTSTYQRLSAKDSELNQLTRVIEEEESSAIGLKEAIHFRMFFNGIAVNTCPHCETKISSQKITREREEQLCRVCDEPITTGTQEQMNFLSAKLEENQLTISRLKKDKKEIGSDISELKLGISILEEQKEDLSSRLRELSAVDTNSINEQIKGLLVKQGKVEGKIEEITSKTVKTGDSITKGLLCEKEVLEVMVSKIEKQAVTLNEALLCKLEESLMDWVVRFGIKNVEAIKIDTRIEPQIIQGGVTNLFSDLVDGEKLRLKISFFIQLMLLASEGGMGKHPQLLLIDSPGTNELIERDFSEIVDVFNQVNEHHSNHCQILIASARSNLQFATHPTKAEVRLNGEPIF